MLSYSEARQKVISATQALLAQPNRRDLSRESVALGRANGRVLAESVAADRDYPPFDRSTRDGFAVHAVDTATAGPGTKTVTLRCIGEIKAGGRFEGRVGPGECVQIMTGAALPQGADAVVMVEHVKVEGRLVSLDKPATPGQSVVLRGREARAGQKLLDAGTRLGYSEMALAAQVGYAHAKVFARPCVAILSTGDEVVDYAATPGPLQVRNSNCLAVQTLAEAAGADPLVLGIAPDEKTELRRFIERGLEADVLVLSGGVSMGKYDLVEAVLAELGAEIFFDSVAIRPGRPAVFGTCRGKPIFGLPGNPVSTIVTFQLFVVPAIDILSGAAPRQLPVLGARLAHDLHEKGALTHFVPARVEHSSGDPQVSVLPWQGSGDVVALAQANAFLIVPAEKLDWSAGEWITLVPRL